MHKAYEIIVSQNGEQSEQNAIANATNTLSQIATDLNVEFDVFDVNVYDGEDGRDYGIGLCAAIDATETTHESFLITLDNESAVESVEEVHHEPLN